MLINTLREGEKVQGTYLCKSKKRGTSKNGKEYESIVLQDKTGELDAKIWNISDPAIEDFDALDYVEINGDATIFNGQLQCAIRRLRKVDKNRVDEAMYFPSTDKESNMMIKELIGFLQSVKEPYLRQLLEKIFVNDTEFIKEFTKHSAAKSVHHGFVGGLLEHTLSVTKICDFYASIYPILNRDLLITAAVCHDIGKVRELSGFPSNDYTDEGQMIGHIVLGAEMIRDKIKEIPGFPQTLASELEHCILAHHGELEYGSPKKPAIIEALALSLADNTDAKIETMKEFIDKDAANNKSDWAGYNKYLETNVRKTSGE